MLNHEFMIKTSQFTGGIIVAQQVSHLSEPFTSHRVDGRHGSVCGGTVLTTIYDEVSTPYTATFLTAGPGARVENTVIQNGCAGDHTEHTDFTYSPRAQSLTLRGLGADVPVVCVAR